MRKSKALLLSLAFLGCIGVGAPVGAARAPLHDNFYWLGQINKASDIINTEQGLLTADQGHRFAAAIHQVLADGERPGAYRPQNVITFEPLLIKAGGPEITMIHAGRSSQDMLATTGRILIREDLLNLADSLNAVQGTLVNLAEKHKDTIVPNYTNGVVAQPNSYGHYLLAYADGFNRDMERVQQYYARLNLSPMGATVLNGTSWPLNRDRMAAYLGFDGLAYNTYDAGQVYTYDNAAESSAVVTSLALHVGGFVEDVMQQYAQPRPWMLLKEGGENTYVSSAMPQKRNPGILNRTRTEASTVLGSAVGSVFRAHNVPPGMADARSSEMNKMLRDTDKVLQNFDKCLRALQIDPERALEELNLDWSASQEVADVLMRKYKVPFRIGHHVNSEIVGYARLHGLTPLTFPYGEVQRIYKETVAASGDKDIPAVLPMSEAEFKATLDPAAIVRNRAVKGGPQPAEMTKMLATGREQLAANRKWVSEKRTHLAAANAKLDQDFDRLRQ
jgi:argininosuccinate lyase